MKKTLINPADSPPSSKQLRSKTRAKRKLMFLDLLLEMFTDIYLESEQWIILVT